jgi:hypothetical protein
VGNQSYTHAFVTGSEDISVPIPTSQKESKIGIKVYVPFEGVTSFAITGNKLQASGSLFGNPTLWHKLAEIPRY